MFPSFLGIEFRSGLKDWFLILILLLVNGYGENIEPGGEKQG